MTLDQAVRITEVLMGLAYCQQNLEHLCAPRPDRPLHLLRLAVSILLVIGWHTGFMLFALLLLGMVRLNRYQGPYNGGSDRMSLLILCCLCLTHWLPGERAREIALGYLALQLTLSYFMAGLVKILNPAWRNGMALRDVFAFSAYPVSESLRNWQAAPRLLLVMSWAIMLFELLFPLSLALPTTLYAALVLAACFHFANACMFGLNRFFWIWIAAYPSLLWLQQRVSLGY